MGTETKLWIVLDVELFSGSAFEELDPEDARNKIITIKEFSPDSGIGLIPYCTGNGKEPKFKLRQGDDVYCSYKEEVDPIHQLMHGKRKENKLIRTDIVDKSDEDKNKNESKKDAENRKLGCGIITDLQTLRAGRWVDPEGNHNLADFKGKPIYLIKKLKERIQITNGPRAWTSHNACVIYMKDKSPQFVLKSCFLSSNGEEGLDDDWKNIVDAILKHYDWKHFSLLKFFYHGYFSCKYIVNALLGAGLGWFLPYILEMAGVISLPNNLPWLIFFAISNALVFALLTFVVSGLYSLHISKKEKKEEVSSQYHLLTPTSLSQQQSNEVSLVSSVSAVPPLSSPSHVQKPSVSFAGGYVSVTKAIRDENKDEGDVDENGVFEAFEGTGTLLRKRKSRSHSDSQDSTGSKGSNGNGESSPDDDERESKEALGV